MQIQTQEILPWFGPLNPHPVPKQPAWDFSYLDFVHPKSTPCTPLDKQPLPNSYNFSLHQEDNFLVHLFSTPRR